MQTLPSHYLVYIGNFLNHGVRELFQGVGAYASERNDFSVDWYHVRDANELDPTSPTLRHADSFLFGNLIPETEAGTLETQMLRIVRKLNPGNRPCVRLVDTNPPMPHSVSIDQPKVGVIAADHLEHRGYRHFAFFGLATILWSVVRRKSFERRLKELGHGCRRHEFESIEMYFRPADHLCKLITELPKPCGIFAANDRIASLLIQAARACRIRIPDQLGILGVDNEPFFNATAGMPISSVDVPFREQGYRAAEMIDRLRKGMPVPRHIRLPPERAIVRASTDMFVVENPLVQRAQAYIEAHRHSPMRVGDLIRILPTTKATLNKHFAQTLAITPSEYILRRRLEYAAEQLRTGKLSVEAVAERCGFSSRHYFGLVFKKLMGFTPGSLVFQTRRLGK